jgi:hypothetical protein
MKKITTSLMAVCAIAGIGSALAFAPKHKLTATHFFVQKPTLSSTLVYSTTAPGHGISCTASGTACSISTTYTINTLNSSFSTALPAEQTDPAQPKFVQYFNSGNFYN